MDDNPGEATPLSAAGWLGLLASAPDAVYRPSPPAASSCKFCKTGPAPALRKKSGGWASPTPFSSHSQE